MKANNLLLFIVASALLTVSTGCPGFGDSDPSDLVDVPDVPPTWDNGIEALVVQRCAGCHTSPPANGAPSSFRLDKFTINDIDDGGLPGASQMASRIFARAVQNEPSAMPPGSPLSLEERTILGEWIMAGAPRNEGEQ